MAGRIRRNGCVKRSRSAPARRQIRPRPDPLLLGVALRAALRGRAKRDPWPSLGGPWAGPNPAKGACPKDKEPAGAGASPRSLVRLQRN
ncbi:MAG: hypothetical protein CME61_07860 [Halobacteriovoraceae bacterium]|nr:hypothetical protein [Halobacteriovoraceae bacterium]